MSPSFVRRAMIIDVLTSTSSAENFEHFHKSAIYVGEENILKRFWENFDTKLSHSISLRFENLALICELSGKFSILQ